MEELLEILEKEELIESEEESKIIKIQEIKEKKEETKKDTKTKEKSEKKEENSPDYKAKSKNYTPYHPVQENLESSYFPPGVLGFAKPSTGEAFVNPDVYGKVCNF
jgi:hypothetical protein